MKLGSRKVNKINAKTLRREGEKGKMIARKGRGEVKGKGAERAIHAKGRR